MPHAAIQRALDESGLTIFLSAPRDVYIIVLQRSLRLLVFGQLSVVLTSFFKALDFSDLRMGSFMTWTLLGDAAGTLLLTLRADKWGRARVLLGGSALMAVSGLVFTVVSNFWLLLFAAMVGVITPNGGEAGPFRSIEEGILAQVTDTDDRSTVFAWYYTITGIALAIGSLTGGWITQAVQDQLGWSPMSSYRLIFGIYAAAGVACMVLSLAYSDRVELDTTTPTRGEGRADEEERLAMMDPRISEDDEEDVGEVRGEGRDGEKRNMVGLSSETKKKVWLLSGLFGLDNLSGGLVPVTIIVYFFTQKFHVDEGTLGNTFFATSLVAAISNIVAGSLARRIGNVPTMAFTHLPSALLMALIPLPSSFQLSRGILLACWCLTKMDIAPRTAFLSSYVHADERLAVMGIVNVVKIFAQSGGPTITGWLSTHGRIGWAFVIAGVLQGVYDVAMLYFFSQAKAIS